MGNRVAVLWSGRGLLNCVLALGALALPTTMLRGFASGEHQRFLDLPHWTKPLEAPVVLRGARVSLPLEGRSQGNAGLVDLTCAKILYRSLRPSGGEGRDLLCAGGARAVTKEARFEAERLFYRREADRQVLSTRDSISGTLGKVFLTAQRGMQLAEGELRVFESVRMFVEGAWRVDARDRARAFRSGGFWRVHLHEDVRMRFEREGDVFRARSDRGVVVLCPFDEGRGSCVGGEEGEFGVDSTTLLGNVVLHNEKGGTSQWRLSADRVEFSDRRFDADSPRLRFPNGDELRGREGRLFLPSGRGIVCGDVHFQSGARSLQGECLRFDLKSGRARLAGQKL